MDAFTGELEFLGASWNDKDGRMVKFRIVEDANSSDGEHPFKQFTRGRGGRAGSRFQLMYSRLGAEEARSCEVMLADWMENAGGRSIKLWVDEEPERHPFEGYHRAEGGATGDKFGAVFREVGDDEQEPVRAETEHGGKKQRLSNVAAMFCREPAFHDFCRTKVKTKRDVVWGEELCARWIRHVCGVSSRAELDTNLEAATMFHKHVRLPYRAYMEHSRQ